MRIDYSLKRNRRSRSLRLRVDYNGEVKVTAPYGVPKFLINRFVDKSKPFIERQKRRLILKKIAYPTLDIEQGVVSYLGKFYQIRFEPGRKERVNCNRDMMYVAPITGLESDVKKTILYWLKKKAGEYLSDKTEDWARVMELDYGKITLRQQRSRWGSCSSRGSISFNWRLIHFKSEVIDYVIIHELAHLEHHDHSKSFWKLVQRHCRDYRAQVKFLKQQVMEIL